MNRNYIYKTMLLFILMPACLACCAASQYTSADNNGVDSILQKLNDATGRLNSYQADVEYLFRQPQLESQTFRTGTIFYQRSEEKSILRVNFETKKQDEEPQEKFAEHYILEGGWLTQIDYQLKQVKIRQLADPNSHMDTFELINRYFPFIGFTRADKLRNDFEIQLINLKSGKSNDLIWLHLKVKPDSVYKNDYNSVDVWIDRQLFLPTKIIAVSTEKDIYEIKLSGIKVNQKLTQKIFEFKIPRDFGKPEIIPFRSKAR